MKGTGAWRFQKLPLPDRFWSRVDKLNSQNGCWLWTGYCGDYGYGEIGINRKVEYTHRYSWIIKNGPIPVGLFVLHSCDNPPCCNPDHLFLGTHKKNMEDCRSKGRNFTPRGEANGRTRLKNKDILKIRALYDSGVRVIDVARGMNVSFICAYYIVKRATWRHLP